MERTAQLPSLLLPLLVLWSVSTLAEGQTPLLDPERVVLETNLGELVLVLYPEIAPQHVQHIKRLVRLGAYHSTFFFRIEQSYLVQLTDVKNRLVALTEEQARANTQIPAEISATLKHKFGLLSMARWDDLDSATSSFSIMLRDAPHLDGEYTIFEHLESGGSVLRNMLRAPRTGNVPLQRTVVHRARVVKEVDDFYRYHRKDPPVASSALLKPYPLMLDPTHAAGSEGPHWMAYVVLTMVIVSLLGVAMY